MTTGLLRKLDDIFIRSYFKEQVTNLSLTWQGFYLQMRQIDIATKARGIKFWYKKELNLDKLPNQEFFEPMSGRVYYCAKRIGNPKGKKVCEHDAYHLLLVRKKREEQPRDMLGPSCWFLTHDTSLICADDIFASTVEKDSVCPSVKFYRRHVDCHYWALFRS